MTQSNTTMLRESGGPEPPTEAASVSGSPEPQPAAAGESGSLEPQPAPTSASASGSPETSAEVAVEHLLRDTGASSQAAQVLLRLEYQRLRRSRAPLPTLADVEFRNYSQNGEDGILLFLFSLIGTTNRTVVEICAGSGIECNAANLLINHGWRGLLVDGDARQIAAGNVFYERCRNTCLSRPTLVASWVTAEGVNDLITAHEFAGEIDLLSLDIDGNDYWIWRALTCIQPRVVVLEFNALLGPEMRVTQPYDPEFRADFSKMPLQCGASLSAFVALGRKKGYRLIGVQSLGFNAFFVRNGIADDVLPEVSPRECYRRVERLRRFGTAWLDLMLRDGAHWQEV